MFSYFQSTWYIYGRSKASDKYTEALQSTLEHHDDLQYHMGRFKHEVFLFALGMNHATLKSLYLYNNYWRIAKCWIVDGKLFLDFVIRTRQPLGFLRRSVDLTPICLDATTFFESLCSGHGRLLVVPAKLFIVQTKLNPFLISHDKSVNISICATRNPFDWDHGKLHIFQGVFGNVIRSMHPYKPNRVLQA